jgi:hypothetical protein
VVFAEARGNGSVVGLKSVQRQWHVKLGRDFFGNAQARQGLFELAAHVGE